MSVKKKIRIISRLDINNDFVIKGLYYEGLRKVGIPEELATKYLNKVVQGDKKIAFSFAEPGQRYNLFNIKCSVKSEKADTILFVGNIGFCGLFYAC